jgi:hypothetical protein
MNKLIPGFVVDDIRIVFFKRGYAGGPQSLAQAGVEQLFFFRFQKNPGFFIYQIAEFPEQPIVELLIANTD